MNTPSYCDATEKKNKFSLLGTVLLFLPRLDWRCLFCSIALFCTIVDVSELLRGETLQIHAMYQKFEPYSNHKRRPLAAAFLCVLCLIPLDCQGPRGNARGATHKKYSKGKLACGRTHYLGTIGSNPKLNARYANSKAAPL